MAGHRGTADDCETSRHTNELTLGIQDVEPCLLGRTETRFGPVVRVVRWLEPKHDDGEQRSSVAVAIPAVGLVVFVSLALGPLLLSVRPTDGARLAVWRDPATLLLIFNSALATAMLAKQWRVMSNLMRRLRTSGALTFDATAVPRIDHEFENAKRWIERIGNPVVKMLLLAGAVSLSSLVYQEISVPSGIYCSEGWWAEYRIGAAMWIAVFGVGLFLVFLHIASGVIFFELTRRMSHHVTFGVNVNNPDGHYGRRAVHELMVAFYVGFLAYSTSIVVILGPLQGHKSRLLMVIAACFLALNPFFVYWPIAMLHRHARDSTASRKELLSDRLVRSDGDLMAREAIQLQLDRVHAIPTALFRWPGIVAGLLAYALPPVLGVVRAVFA